MARFIITARVRSIYTLTVEAETAEAVKAGQYKVAGIWGTPKPDEGDMEVLTVKEE